MVGPTPLGLKFGLKVLKEIVTSCGLLDFNLSPIEGLN